MPFAIGAITPKKSWKMVRSLCAAMVSALVGAACGNSFRILLSRHLLTEALVAVTNACGGSKPKTSSLPRSSMIESGPFHFHPSLSIVATSAVAGPVTLAQSERFVPTSFSLAILSVVSFSAFGNHCSQKARAQYFTGPVCASNAGSAVPLDPSSVAQNEINVFATRSSSAGGGSGGSNSVKRFLTNTMIDLSRSQAREGCRSFLHDLAPLRTVNSRLAAVHARSYGDTNLVP